MYVVMLIDRDDNSIIWEMFSPFDSYKEASDFVKEWRSFWPSQHKAEIFPVSSPVGYDPQSEKNDWLE
jgi:hypothetical protein